MSADEVSGLPAGAGPLDPDPTEGPSGEDSGAAVAPVPDASATARSPEANDGALASDASATAPSREPGDGALASAAVPSPEDGEVASESDCSAPARSREPDEEVLRLAEAAIFACVTPMTPRALSQILPDDVDANEVIVALRPRYAGRGIELVEIGGGLRFRTAADLAPQLRKVIQVPRRLPRVAMETLAIVAYHQPITRPEIEEMRGASLSQQTLDLLLENDLITARGRKETPGRPTLWGTTAKFLEYFGLRDIRELPRRQDLLLEATPAAAVAEATVDGEASDAPPA